MRFSGYFDFYFNSIQTGGDVTQNIQIIDNRVQNFTQNMQRSTSMAANYSSGLRRLALDLRLMSSGIRQVVSTLNLQDTVVGKAADGITILASSAVVAISTFNAWTRINTQFSGQILGATMQAIVTLTPVIAFLAANMLPLIVIVALLAAGFVAINYVWGQTSGITRYRESIKSLEDDVESLESSLRSLRLEQGQLGVQSAALAAEQAGLDAQMAMGAISAGAYAEQSEILDANRSALGAQTAELAFNESYYQSQVDQSKASIEDYNQVIEDTNDTARENLLSTFDVGGQSAAGFEFGKQIRTYFQSLLGFESGGVVSATGPIMAHAGEQLIPAGEGGGGVSLTISLEGAHIYGREGMEQALEVGGAKLKKQLEYMRRPRARW